MNRHLKTRSRHMARLGLFLALLIMLGAPDATAQDQDCATALTTAEQHVAAAEYDLALSWIDFCLDTLNPTGEEAVRAYRLKTIAYLYKEVQARALDAAIALLSIDPSYQTTDDDPPAFAELIGSIHLDTVPPNEDDPTTRPVKMQDYVEVEVFYGTDRLPTGSARPATYYGGERGTFEVGTCRVSIPKGHQIGALESPAWWKLEFRADPARHIVLLEVLPTNADPFFERLRGSVAASGEQALLVFVHGYNVTFEDAARRTAQMAYDLGFDGVPAFYSWPANGGLLDYPADEADVQWTAPHLKAFLQDLAERSGAQKIHLIGHSMGNRALTAALREIAAEHETPLFNQVILTAPDIDADIFVRDVVPAIRPSAARLTLYASSQDRALQLSHRIHQYPRAGDSGTHLVLTEGLDTIDASVIDTGLLGHSYFAETRALLTDLYLLMRHGHPPLQRNLMEHAQGTQSYWTFR